MRDNRSDKTIERNLMQKWRFLIKEYELVKAKQHPQFRFLQDFYAFHGTNRQTFAKYYNRFRQAGSADALLPRKRGSEVEEPAHLALHRAEGAGAAPQGYQPL